MTSDLAAAYAEATGADAPDGARVLADVERFLRRFVAFPSDGSAIAVTLWAAHAHLVDAGENTPRLAVVSPEPGSGKTRCLEVLDLLVPRPMHALNASPAPTFRSIAAARRTLLFDEVDALFGRPGKDDPAADLRALLNAGHRKGATIPRCVGPRHEVVDFPVFAAAALAGLGDLPDTLMTRSVIIRMRRRAPGERIEPFRRRLHAPEGERLRDALAGWADTVADEVAEAWPDMPPGIEDRPADVWEPLLAVADAAGGDWPQRARAACLELVKVAVSGEASLGVRLLGDIRHVFTSADVSGMSTKQLLAKLHELDEAPWGDLHGKPLDARGLAHRLRQYDARPHQFKIDNDDKVRGYSIPGSDTNGGGLHDAFTRYLPPHPPQAGTDGTSGTAQVSDPRPVPESDAGTGTDMPAGTGDKPVTCGVPAVPEVPPQREGDGAGRLRLASWTPQPEPVGACHGCGEPALTVDESGRPCHVGCALSTELVPTAAEPAPGVEELPW